ncbi:MAG: phytoene/squalene synthase family protein [Ilumatobacteraceae bacterium]
MTALDASYDRCRDLARAHGTTYYWATALLPRDRRPHVWALYAFARYADDIVDDLDDRPACERAAALAELGTRFFRDLEAGESDHPVLAAVVHTVVELGHDPEVFHRFLRSMTMDLSITGYDTWNDLLEYMDGSAAVIGEMMLPVLRPTTPRALEPARDLGFAFQLTNFLRDVGEDLGRGRVYLPREDLDRFGADPSARRVDAAWRDLMRFEISRCRRLYRSADTGVVMLTGSSRRCVRAARNLYSQILDRIERADYDVFSRRARVPTWQKLTTVAVDVVRR